MFCVCKGTFQHANHRLRLVLPAESPGRVGTLHLVPGTSQPMTLGTPARLFPKPAQACASPAPSLSPRSWHCTLRLPQRRKKYTSSNKSWKLKTQLA